MTKLPPLDPAGWRAAAATIRFHSCWDMHPNCMSHFEAAVAACERMAELAMIEDPSPNLEPGTAEET